ncbi:hypothetical protein HK102_014005 [Quaeritorhiza haematococci]|nr:hypothetical protein HK102_014005 [Quaeritorhiza haematococci]
MFLTANLALSILLLCLSTPSPATALANPALDQLTTSSQDPTLELTPDILPDTPSLRRQILPAPAPESFHGSEADIAHIRAAQLVRRQKPSESRQNPVEKNKNGDDPPLVGTASTVAIVEPEGREPDAPRRGIDEGKIVFRE